MNTGNQPLIILQSDCNSAVSQISGILRSAGCYVIQSFDLHSAMETQPGCTCPPDTCNCQMVVLLVYDQEGPPDTLVFDSRQTQTFVYWVNNPSRPVHPDWLEKLAQLLPNPFFSVNQISPCLE